MEQREMRRSQRCEQGARFISGESTIELLIRDITGYGAHRRAHFSISGIPNKDYIEAAPESGIKHLVDGIDLQVRTVYREKGKSVVLTYWVSPDYRVQWIN